MMSRSSPFDKALEKATSQLQLELDWDAVLQICDFIRQEDVNGKYAISALKKKISVENPHVSLFALQTLESVVKNCGALIHKEVATREFMEYMKDLCKVKTDAVKTKVLELIQIWSHAFRNETSYKIVTDTYNVMKVEGYSFPTLKEADAMFSAETAPEWKEADNCSRCRTAFGTLTRKHHCRHCGDVFCKKCSSKLSIIPKFGIEREVRVCDHCYDVLNPLVSGKKEDDSLPAEYLASPLSKQSQAPPTQTEQELKEKEDLELALALSQSEQESKSKKKFTNFSAPSTQSYQPSTSIPVDTSQIDPELAHYLNRNYWQQKSSETTKAGPSLVASTTTPSAPVVGSEPMYAPVKVQEAYQNGETDGEEQFINALVGSVEIFVNRMKSNSIRGRSIANDTSVQSLFTVISNMHPQLMTYLQNQEDLRGRYETLQDKLAQLRDAREALDALRDDHADKKRREWEEMERRRQIQMAHKLEIMRQKKHEYLEAQRQHALQKLQEQEREMQMRFEKQKQLTQMRQMQAYAYPQQLYNQAMGQGQMMGPGQPIMDGMQQPMMGGSNIPINQTPGVGPQPVLMMQQSDGGTPTQQLSNTSISSQGMSSQYQHPPPGPVGVPNQATMMSGQLPNQPGVTHPPGQVPQMDPNQAGQSQMNAPPGSIPQYQMQGGTYQQIANYPPYNMQGLASNLPNPPQYGQQAPTASAPQGPSYNMQGPQQPQAPPPAAGAPFQGQFAPQPGQQSGMQPGQQPVQGQQTAQQRPDEQLISFD